MAATSLSEVKNGTAAAAKPKDFPGMLTAFLPEIKRALPKHLNADRMCRVALTCFRMTPKLGECDPRSVFAAVIQASQLGLEPGLLGQAYLIPYGKQCNLIPGYQGLIELARRSGKIASLYAHAVRENDEFEYELGTDKTLRHKPLMDEDARGEIIAFYAVAKLADGGVEFEVMSKGQVDKIMRATQSGGRSGPWKDHYEEMGRKTAIRRLFKWLPKSIELTTALALDDAAGKGAQNLTVEGAIEGEFVAVDEGFGDGASDGGPAVDPATGEIVNG